MIVFRVFPPVDQAAQWNKVNLCALSTPNSRERLLRKQAECRAVRQAARSLLPEGWPRDIELPVSQRRRWPKPSPTSEKVVSSAKKLPSKCPQRLERFLRCCRFRSLHLAFWLLLSFARDALVHFLAICIPTSVERPDPPRFGATGVPDFAGGPTTTRQDLPRRILARERRDQLSNGCDPDWVANKESPGNVRGFKWTGVPERTNPLDRPRIA
jgi:hypothetical protein